MNAEVIIAVVAVLGVIAFIRYRRKRKAELPDKPTGGNNPPRETNDHLK